MDIGNLPRGSAPEALDFSHFPTRWQALVWRNWEMVPVGRLAEVLGTSVKNVLAAAERMGLPVPPRVETSWIEKGYITIIRNNWHILDYPQLLQLLGWEAKKLERVLLEEDFMWVKMGSLKPSCGLVEFGALTMEEKEKTAWLKKIFLRHFPEGKKRRLERPFAFSESYGPKREGRTEKSRFEFSLVHPFSASCGDVFSEGVPDPIPENLLRQYASMGINGVWLHAVLHLLHPVKGAEEFSRGHEARIENLAALAERCSRRGVGLYLYLNEPRGMPESFYGKLPEWRGVKLPGCESPCNCTTRTKEPLRWMEEACATVFAKSPELAGVFMITMSENPTHCHSHMKGSECPWCGRRAVPDVVAEVVSAVERGVHSSAPGARVVAWDWSWKPTWTEESVDFETRILEKLPRNVLFMRVSEWGKETSVGGVRGSLTDYSISQVGPSEKSLELWKRARKLGFRTVAKAQVNNSWEFSAVPYIPVPYLVREHLDNIVRANIDGLMLSWTHGGWPGGNLELLDKPPEELARDKFGDDAAPLVCGAWKIFSEAFREFPFSSAVMYFSPANFGPANQLRLSPTGRKATMIGFPYDDLEKWRSFYPEDIFEKQFKKLSETWAKGLPLLKRASRKISPRKRNDFIELENMAVAAYCHFKSTYLQIRFVRCRSNKLVSKDLISILKEEIQIAKKLHNIVQKDSRVGFETSNHYYYSLNDLREKVLNCQHVLKQIEEDCHK